jgi:hypothetical protein
MKGCGQLKALVAFSTRKESSLLSTEYEAGRVPVMVWTLRRENPLALATNESAIPWLSSPRAVIVLTMLPWLQPWLADYLMTLPHTVCRKVAGSIPDGVIGIFHWHNPSGRTTALGLTQPLTEISTRNISWGAKAASAQDWQPYHLHVPTVLKSGSLNLLEPSGPVMGSLYLFTTYSTTNEHFNSEVVWNDITPKYLPNLEECKKVSLGIRLRRFALWCTVCRIQEACQVIRDIVSNWW